MRLSVAICVSVACSVASLSGGALAQSPQAQIDAVTVERPDVARPFGDAVDRPALPAAQPSTPDPVLLGLGAVLASVVVALLLAESASERRRLRRWRDGVDACRMRTRERAARWISLNGARPRAATPVSAPNDSDQKQTASSATSLDAFLATLDRLEARHTPKASPEAQWLLSAPIDLGDVATAQARLSAPAFEIVASRRAAVAEASPEAVVLAKRIEGMAKWSTGRPSRR